MLQRRSGCALLSLCLTAKESFVTWLQQLFKANAAFLCVVLREEGPGTKKAQPGGKPGADCSTFKYVGLAKTIHTYIRIYGVYTVILAVKLPYIRSYTVFMYGSDQPYEYARREIEWHTGQMLTVLYDARASC